jgi:hypothetical protein
LDLLSYKNEGMAYLTELANRKNEGNALNLNLRNKLDYFKKTIEKYQDNISKNDLTTKKVRFFSKKLNQKEYNNFS